MKRVGYVVATDSLSLEEGSGRSYLQSCKTLQSSIIPLIHLSSTPVRALPALLWWHYDSSTQFPPDALNPEVISAIRRYLRSGGSLLLTLLAAQYVVDLGIEIVRPNVITKGAWKEQCWAKDYPDIRGLASFQGHPVFDGLHGAAYTWSAAAGADYSCAIYENPCLPKQGRIVAIERQYIRLNEERRVAVEYRVGKGRVLAVGMHLYFADNKNRFRPHLERVAGNCLAYLAQLNPLPPSLRKRRGIEGDEFRKSHSHATYWPFEPRTIRLVHHKSSPLKIATHTLKIQQSGLRIDRERATENFFNVGGRRMLIMGTEKTGIEEVWVHPVRVLRNLRVGFKIGGAKTIWSNTHESRITVRPESISREFGVGETQIIETVFADPKLPAGGIHYDIKSQNDVEILVCGEIDLRMMWPLSENATGPLEHSWDRGLQAVVVKSSVANLVAIVGISKKPQDVDHESWTLNSPFPLLGREGSRVSSVSPPDVKVPFCFKLQLDAYENRFTLCFAGSNQGMKEAEGAYRSFMNDPLVAHNRQASHFKGVLNSASHVSDPEINDAYRWAITGIDRFFVETPGVGRSLMAGYATTKSGWDGGHAISGRPGYAWYFGRDSVWTSLALLAHGKLQSTARAKARFFSMVRSVLEFLGRYQDITGKILHECTTSGFIHYDAGDSTPLYVMLMGRYLRASRDMNFVKKEYHRLVKAIEFCFSTDTDGDHLIENTNVGHGWIEGGPLFPAHAELYLNACWCAALEEAAYVAQKLNRRKVAGLPAEAPKTFGAKAGEWKREAVKIRRIINEKFWNTETGLYNFAKNPDGRFNTARTILPAVAMYFGLTDADKAKRSLHTYSSKRFLTDWGVRLISSNDPVYNASGYHSGSVWPLFTGWVALAAKRYGERELGARLAKINLLLYKQFGSGYTPEVLHGERCELAGVCAHQAWSEAMAVLPLLEGKSLTG